MKAFVDLQKRLSEQFDHLLPPVRQVRGNRDFISSFVPGYLRPGLRIADVGGGRSPLLTCHQKLALSLQVTGLDISADSLAAAPPGSYDQTVQADVTKISGVADHDLVICQSLLEHVESVDGALRGLASLVKPG